MAKTSIQTTDTTNVFKLGCLVHLQIRHWSGIAKLPKDKLGEELPKDVVRAIHDLLEDKTELDDLNQLRNEAKRHLVLNSIPFPVDTLFFIPKNKVIDMDDFMREKKEEWTEVLEKFLSKYDQRKMAFKEKYPDLYRPEKYPDVGNLRARFSFTWTFRQFTVPDTEMQILSPELYKEEMEKFKQEMQDMKQMTVDHVANEFLRRISSIRKQCESGKMNTTTIKGINTFLDKFDDLWDGFMAHKELKKAIAKVKKSIGGTDVEKFRGSEDFRNKVAKQMDGIVKQINKMDDINLKRQIDL